MESPLYYISDQEILELVIWVNENQPVSSNQIEVRFISLGPKIEEIIFNLINLDFFYFKEENDVKEIYCNSDEIINSIDTLRRLILKTSITV